jgi:hypothetical protein
MVRAVSTHARLRIGDSHIRLPWCGDHNRVVVLTSDGTVSRCLRWRDETIQPAACTSHTLLRQMRSDFAKPRISPAHRAISSQSDDV